MTAQELKRVEHLQKIEEKRLSQKEGAAVLGCFIHVTELQARYREDGWLASSQRRGIIGHIWTQPGK